MTLSVHDPKSTAIWHSSELQVLKDFGSDYGVFTRDYRINALEARVLITVPACLEILLFSQAQREWVKKLRYVIFDEVHCMREGGIKEGGTVENTGAIWEHCLLLIRYASAWRKEACSSFTLFTPSAVFLLLTIASVLLSCVLLFY